MKVLSIELIAHGVELLEKLTVESSKLYETNLRLIAHTIRVESGVLPFANSIRRTQANVLAKLTLSFSLIMKKLLHSTEFLLSFEIPRILKILTKVSDFLVEHSEFSETLKAAFAHGYSLFFMILVDERPSMILKVRSLVIPPLHG